MSNLRGMVVRYLRRITMIIVFVMLLVVILTQILGEQLKAKDSSKEVFVQIENILAENQVELEEIKEDYTKTCLTNAEAIAYIIENNPDIVNSMEELKKIARLVEVDEIHIFNQEGRIFAGTHPEYYDYTFESGEQMGFF